MGKKKGPLRAPIVAAGLYVNYAALTSCWIQGFPPLLENSAFQREMDDNAPEQEGNELMEQEESEEDLCKVSVFSKGFP